MDETLESEKFGQLLREFYQEHDKDKRLREDHERSLPLQDATIDRWDCAKSLGFTDVASIYNCSAVFRKLIVGPNILLDASGGGLAIDEFCSISSGVPEATIVSGPPAKHIGAIEGSGEKVKLNFGDSPS